MKLSFFSLVFSVVQICPALAFAVRSGLSGGAPGGDSRPNLKCGYAILGAQRTLAKVTESFPETTQTAEEIKSALRRIRFHTTQPGENAEIQAELKRPVRELVVYLDCEDFTDAFSKNSTKLKALERLTDFNAAMEKVDQECGLLTGFNPAAITPSGVTSTGFAPAAPLDHDCKEALVGARRSINEASRSFPKTSQIAKNIIRVLDAIEALNTARGNQAPDQRWNGLELRRPVGDMVAYLSSLQDHDSTNQQARVRLNDVKAAIKESIFDVAKCVSLPNPPKLTLMTKTDMCNLSPCRPADRKFVERDMDANSLRRVLTSHLFRSLGVRI